MEKKLNIYQVDAFSRHAFKGNPAGVVSNADGLNDYQMQNIARELNNSETAFIFKPDDTSHDLRVRFFTPSMEVPSCGHASISAGYIWSKERNFKKLRFHQKIKIGILPLELILNQDKYMAYMTQAKPVFGTNIEGELLMEVIEALGIVLMDLRRDLPVQTVSTGHGKLLIPLKSKSVLNTIRPNYDKLISLSGKIGQNGFFPFVLDDSEAGVLTHARMFAPSIGINEDPVTGNGNGPLGAYLIKNNAVTHDDSQFNFVSHQGEKMNRSGYAHVQVSIKDGQPKEVKVGGHCTIAFETKIKISI